MIFTAIGTAIAGALFAGSVLAATLIAGGLAFAAKLGLSYLTRQKTRKYSAVQGEVQYGADVPVGTVFGTGKVKGHRAFYAKWGSGNKFNADVFLLANGWCDGLAPYVYFYGQQQNLVVRPIIGNETAHYGVAGFDDLISIRFYDGRPGQGVDQKLVNDTANIGRKWKPTSVCAGMAYVVFERKYDGDKFEKGAPEVEWILRGLREYDVRKDSTVAGGSGPHRLDNPATWEFSENPAIHRFNYQIGLRGRVSGRTLIGEGKSIGQLDLSSYIASMNVCDTPRKGKPTYTASLYVTGDDDHTEILKEFDDAMAGFGLNRRGLSGVIAGAPQVPVMNITPIDISVERETEIQTRKSAFDLYNVMSGQFLSPDSNWNPESLNTIKVNADIAADGRTRQIANDFLQVTDSDTAQYLLNIRYRQQRKGGTATLPVSRRVGLNVTEGEWITYDGKTWMVSEWRIDDKFRFTLILTETGADIYAEGGIEPGPIVIPPTEPFNPSLLSTVQNFNVEVGMIFGADGYERPVLCFSWTPPEDPTVTAVRFFYKIANEMEIFEDQCTSPEDGTYITSKNVESGMFYEARATITTVPDRFKSYTPWKTTVTPTGMQSIAVYLKAVQEDMRDVLKTAWAEADRYRELFERISLDAAAGTGTNVVDRQVYTEKFTNTTAQIIEEKRIRADADGALAEVTTAISAQIDDPNSGLVANATGLQQITAEVRDDETGLSALALAMIGVEASIGDLSAGGLISFQAQVPPPAGVLSQISILARANTSSQFIQSGMVIQVYQEGAVLKSRILNIATQFVIWDGNAANLPFVFEDGILKLAGARLGTLYFDQLQSTNGKLIIRGSGNLADIRMFF